MKTKNIINQILFGVSKMMSLSIPSERNAFNTNCGLTEDKSAAHVRPSYKFLTSFLVKYPRLNNVED